MEKTMSKVEKLLKLREFVKVAREIRFYGFIRIRFAHFASLSSLRSQFRSQSKDSERNFNG